MTVAPTKERIDELTRQRDLALANADAVYARLMPEVERLRAALTWYADVNNWPHPEQASDDQWCEALNDQGERAKTALGLVEQTRDEK